MRGQRKVLRGKQWKSCSKMRLGPPHTARASALLVRAGGSLEFLDMERDTSKSPLPSMVLRLCSVGHVPGSLEWRAGSKDRGGSSQSYLGNNSHKTGAAPEQVGTGRGEIHVENE